MQITPLKNRFSSHLTSVARRRGAALIVVLSVLVLITILAVGFFSTVSTELVSSKSHASSTAARRQADTATELVMSQVRAASSGLDRAWASQPGLLRTWDINGTPSQFYKLYSDANMILDGAGFQVADAAPPSNWDDSPGTFTDLNSPVVRGSTVHFPVIDPRAKTNSAATSIEGFDYSATINGVVLPSASPASQRLPLPVRWLYMLEDGTLATPISESAGVVSFDPANLPSASNPIVARVAFWTDDDTNKVNINTASEGIYYDIPRFYSRDEKALAQSPPVVGEYQRYPGHPATTSLSTVFGPWLATAQSNFRVGDFDKTKKYFDLAPRVASSGGTQGGTVNSSAGLPRIPNEAERLYASLDEMLYEPGRTANLQEITNDVLEKTRFFLSPYSRAPDVTLHDTPRVTIWPIPAKTGNYRTPQDELLAFCSTVGGHLFAFQRDNPKSQTADYAGIPRNAQIFNYLRTLTSQNIPGFGASLESAWTAPERDQILVGIFDYIRSSNLNDPNLGNNFMYTDSYSQHGWWAAWDNNRSPGQVLPISVPVGSTTYKGAGRFPVIDQVAMVFYMRDQPTVVGNVITARLGALLLLNLHHSMLGAMNAIDHFKVLASVSDGNFSMTFKSLDPNWVVTPSAPQSLNMMNGATQVLWANYPSRISQNGRNWGGNHTAYPFFSKRGEGKSTKEEFTFRSYSNVEITLTGTVPPGESPHSFLRKKLRWDFSGGTFDVRILAADSTEAAGSGYNEVQRYTFEFPAITGDATSGLRCPTGYSWDGGANYYTFDINGRFFNPSPTNRVPFLGSDVVRALQVDHLATNGPKGDNRILSYTRNVPKEWFTPHKDYAGVVDSSHSGAVGGPTDYAHTMRQSVGDEWWGAASAGLGGNLVTDVGSSVVTKRPFIRPEINGVAHNNGGQGDWDNGFGSVPDGPYLNRADEGIAPDPAGNLPYFDYDGLPQNGNLTTPNRQMPSPVIFGSLPTGAQRVQPWQTLLFRPDSTDHPGLGVPQSGPPFTKAPDYLLLDLFQMPIVEPYAISEPLSTAGRVNMNFQIIPFSHITRETGVRAVLKNERITAIPSSYTTYKTVASEDNPGQFRHPVNLDETLQGFYQRFANNDIFRSASEICGLHIVPERAGVNHANMDAFWPNHALTGDNTRERIYTTLYPRLTTQSNTYTVHMRAQILQKIRTGDQAVWHEGRDKVLSEYRGSTTIERYVDPRDANLPDFATDPSARLAPFYKFRVVNNKQFAP